MTLPVWPTSLGNLRPNVSGLSIEPFRPRKVTEFDDGPPRSRRTSLVDMAKFKGCALVFTEAQLSTFLAFVRDSLNGGAMKFTAPLIVGAGGLATKTCRIDAGPEVSYLGPNVAQVGFDMIVWGWR